MVIKLDPRVLIGFYNDASEGARSLIDSIELENETNGYFDFNGKAKVGHHGHRRR